MPFAQCAKNLARFVHHPTTIPLSTERNERHSIAKLPTAQLHHHSLHYISILLYNQITSNRKPNVQQAQLRINISISWRCTGSSPFARRKSIVRLNLPPPSFSFSLSLSLSLTVKFLIIHAFSGNRRIVIQRLGAGVGSFNFGLHATNATVLRAWLRKLSSWLNVVPGRKLPQRGNRARCPPGGMTETFLNWRDCKSDFHKEAQGSQGETESNDVVSLTTDAILSRQRTTMITRQRQ